MLLWSTIKSVKIKKSLKSKNNMKINFNKFAKLLVSIIICELAGVVGSIFTTPQIKGWYAGLEKPFFNPPNWIFAPVWTTLFVLMGISLWMIWIEKTKISKKKAILIFAGQLILNTLWSFMFFGLNSPVLGFLIIVPLWIAIFLTIKEFYKISKIASYLLVPYILWVSFASVLNASLWFLN